MMRRVTTPCAEVLPMSVARSSLTDGGASSHPRCGWGLLLLVLALAGLPVGRASGQSAQPDLFTVVPAAGNTSFPDEDGDHPAYIEVRAQQATVLLSNYYLTDQPNSPTRWRFPDGYTLAPGQSIRVFASGKNRRPTGPGGKLHTSFAFDCFVPYCGLFDLKPTQVDLYSNRTNLCDCEGLNLINSKTVARTLIPVDDPGPGWNLPGFDDSQWIRGKLGVGYESGASPFQTGLILYHTLDKADVSQTVVKDVSGPVLHTGTIAGVLPMVTGRVGQGLEFKGDPSLRIRVPHHAELDPGNGDFSVGVWFKALRGSASINGNTFSESLLSKTAAGTGGGGTAGQESQGWSIVRTHAGTAVAVGNSLGNRSVQLGVTAAGQWNHAVLVVNRASGQLIGYLNGKRMGVATLGALASLPIGTTGDLLQGQAAGGVGPYAGVLDDVAIWSRALNDGQVADLYGAGQQGKSLLDSTAFPAGTQMYAGLIGTDVLAPMKGIHTSAYIRVPFNLPVLPGLAAGLKLRLHYNDGFVAYLNGIEVARRNAPETVDNFSAAEVDRPDAAALVSELFDLGPYAALVKPGGNVLAFQGLTRSANSERFLIAPSQLCLEVLRDPRPGDDCVRETNGREFWVTFPQNYVQEPDTPLRLSLCIAGTPKTVGVVEIPGLPLPGFPRAFSIPPAGSIVIDIPRAVELSGTDVIEPKAVHVIASADVAVYGTSRMDFTTDSYLALPNKCLGTEYLVCTYRNVFNGIPVLNGTQFAIVGIANGTEVTIVPPGPVAGHPGLQPFVIKLNRGETYQLRNEAGSPADLTGARIVATKPVAVFGSHRCANVQSVGQFFCDTIVEELLPLSSWGRGFFVVPLATRKFDTVRVLSGSDDNLVTVTTAAGAEAFNLAKAAFKDVILDKPARITSRGPLTVMQFATSSDADHVADADPFMALIQPENTWLTQYRLCTPPAGEFGSNYLNLVGPSGSVLDLTTINGVALMAWDPTRIVRGSLPGGYFFARVSIDAGNSYHVIGRAPLGLTAYGFSEFDSYGYPGGMRFEGATPPLLTCPGDLTIACQSVAGAPDCVAPVPDLTLRIDVFDDCGASGRVSVTQTPKPGTLLKPGTYTITLFATDGDGETAQCVTKLVVEPKWTEQTFGANIAANPALETTVWGATADPDRDGLINAIEEAMGSNPNQANALGDMVQVGVEGQSEGTFPVITFQRPTSEGAPQIELEGLSAFDGSPWQAGDDLFEELPQRNNAVPGGRHERATFRLRQPVPGGTNSAFFFRVRLRP